MKLKKGAEKEAWEKELRERYSFHPSAERFPMMADEQFTGFADDIEANGQNQPIVTFRYQIIDGRNRFKACLERGVEPLFKEYERGDDTIDTFIISENFKRRHLSPDQRQEFVIKLHQDGWTQAKIAKDLGISEGAVNKYLKDKLKNEDTKTRVDSAGRIRPTKYNKQPKVETQETPEEKLERRKEEAKDALENWREDFSDLDDLDIVGILKKFYSEICQGKKSKN